MNNNIVILNFVFGMIQIKHVLIIIVQHMENQIHVEHLEIIIILF